MRLIDADALIEKNMWEVAVKDMFHLTEWVKVVSVVSIEEAPTIETKQIKYFDEDEKVWKIGNVIMEQKNEPQAEMPEYAEWKEPFEKMTDCPWK